jgi:hypothetical protein
MNPALCYLYLTLLKRRALYFCRGLRRPTTLLGFAAVLGLIWILFHFRHEALFAQLVRPESLVGGMLVMLCGSLFKGFLERGLEFDPPDIEFLFTSPFTQRQIVLYRLLPSYLFALVQGLVFLALFTPHLKHPLMMTIGFSLFQIACFHVSTGAAIFAGTISGPLHYRIRWLLLAGYFLLTAVYLRAAWDIRIVPAFLSSPWAQLVFYPAVTWSDVGTAPQVAAWSSCLINAGPFSTQPFWRWLLCLGVPAMSAIGTLGLLFKLKGNVLEASLATTTRAAEKRLRVQQGRRAAVRAGRELRSARLPGLGLFRGVGAVVWKNLVVARRSKRELVLALAFTAIYVGFLAAIRWALHDAMSKGGGLTPGEVADFDGGIVLLLGVLAFLLQWTCRFDFRCDGHHLVGFRTLPVSPFALALAEIAVPTAICLAFQAVGIVALLVFGRFDWSMLLVMLLAYPAVALAVNGVWNLHYLLSATRRAGGKAQSTSAVATLMVVALSFLIFYPAGWMGMRIGDAFDAKLGIPLAITGGIAVQYFVDFLLLLVLARLFQNFQVSRGFS